MSTNAPVISQKKSPDTGVKDVPVTQIVGKDGKVKVTVKGLEPIPESPATLKARQDRATYEAEQRKREAPQRYKDTIRSLDEA